MDSLERAWYEEKFENRFLRAKAEAFQTFFNELMARAYPNGDFMPCRPWGAQGDKKNDGFHKSAKRLFQVYGPNKMTESAAKNKMTEDFNGALAHWGTHFTSWVFVHNADNGVPPHFQEFILDMEAKNPGVKIDMWGLEELRSVFHTLPHGKLQSWLGHAPSRQIQAHLGFQDIKPILDGISAKEPNMDAAVGIVPAGKLQANDLSSSIQGLLQAGMRKAPLVEQFFQDWHDESYGARIAEAFKQQYAKLKNQAPPSHPNEIFQNLRSWAEGVTRPTPEREVATLAILAYFFERCDIFEAPRPITS